VEGKLSFLGSLIPADPAFKPWCYIQATNKVIFKVKMGKKGMKVV
jgi:hypothetical protein